MSIISIPLWHRVIEQTQHASACGALQSLTTAYEFVEQDGIRFLVRILGNLERKLVAQQQQDQATKASGQFVNPFLPYEEDLFVTELSETHVCLLNKFNVVDHHLLIITRQFEEQETLLNLQDFEATCRCLAEVEGLVFYNSGKLAGASQRHKHLQLVPLPIAPEDYKIPIEPVLASAVFQDRVGTIPEFPFKHAFLRFNSDSEICDPAGWLSSYQILLKAVGIYATDNQQQSSPYNLLATREWMLIVPRSQEQYEAISVNSLGFAGALLVRNQAQLELLKQQGPITILQQVAVANSTSDLS